MLLCIRYQSEMSPSTVMYKLGSNIDGSIYLHSPFQIMVSGSYAKVLKRRLFLTHSQDAGKES